MRGVIVLLMAWLLTACAGQSQQSAGSQIDWEEVGKVEAAHGTRTTPSRIIWVNPPRKPVPQENSDNES